MSPSRHGRDGADSRGSASPASLELAGVCFVVDPWASPHELRLIPSPDPALAAEGVDWLLVTHEHLTTSTSRFCRSTSSDRRPLVVPAPVVLSTRGRRSAAASRRGAARRVARPRRRRGSSRARLSLRRPTRTATRSLLGGKPRFVGYVLAGGRRVYHSGDTIVTDALTEALTPLGVDVALLPINGRDAEREARGIVGNMNAAGGGRARPRHRRNRSRAAPLGRVRREHRPAGVRGRRGGCGRLSVVVPARFRPCDLESTRPGVRQRLAPSWRLQPRRMSAAVSAISVCAAVSAASSSPAAMPSRIAR